MAPTLASLTGLTPSGPVVARTGQRITGLRITNPDGSCVVIPPGVTDVTVEGNAIGPCGTTVEDLGVRVQSGATRIVVRRNVIHDVASGVQVWAATNPIVIEANRVYDVRGPMPRGQMVQFDSVTGPGESRIVGNVSDASAATIATRYEDHISMYKSSGTAAQPILIACNKLRGGNSATGSGIMVGDNGGGFFTIRDNVVVLTPNTGIGVAGGHDVSVTGNLLFNRGSSEASLTSNSMTLFTYAGYTPRNVTMAGNRGAANWWQYGGGGALGTGLWTDNTGVNVVDRDNRWQDLSLTADIWNTTPASCV